MNPSMSAARKKKTMETPMTGMDSIPDFLSEALRDNPFVLTHDIPSRSPAAAANTMAVNSNGPWAVTNSTKL